MVKAIFSGKNVAITGASSGLGYALALEFARQGANLALVARRIKPLEVLRDECEKLGAKVWIGQCDVTQSSDVEQCVASICHDLGEIDIVVANAGISNSFQVDDFSALKANEMIDVNVKGVINTIGATLPKMLQKKSGVLVGISSLASYVSFPQSYVYCGTKAAINAIFNGLRRELHPTNIKVTLVCPGFIRTDMTTRNKFQMPFLMDVDEAARRIVLGVHKGVAVLNFPRRLRLIMRIISVLPEAIIRLPFRGRTDLKGS
jgi:short-subunit dehydrogenase